MALINCPECNKEISDKVKACPFCGFPFESNMDSKNDVQQVEIASVNFTPKDPAKTKQLTLGAIIAVTVVVLGIVFFSIIKNIKYNAYIDDLESVSETMLEGASEAESLLNLTGRVWYNTIYEERDPETDRYTMSGGAFNDDFNTSIVALFDFDLTKSIIDLIDAYQVLVDLNMRDLQNPPDGLENCYATATELYAAYNSLTDFAINPSGNLQSFSESKMQKVDKFMELYQKLETQIPE
jgi:hypothetical protein